MTDEREVRTRAGWIGVEISKSRARKASNPEYGLYRVRGSFPVLWSVRPGEEIDRSQGQGEPTMWTAYAFTLDEIGRAVTVAIECGTPAGPQEMGPRDALTGETVRVPTRWTQAYRGRRDLGVQAAERSMADQLGDAMRRLTTGPEAQAAGELFRQAKGYQALKLPIGGERAIKPEWAAELDALAALLDAGLVKMQHVEDCACRLTVEPIRMTAECVRATMPERMRQRAENAEFQREHLERRAYGLKKRHRAKLEHNEHARQEARGGDETPQG